MNNSTIAHPPLSPYVLTQTQARVCALSAIFQSALLCHDIATGKKISQSALKTSLLSILRLQSKGIEDIYGKDRHGLSVGLNALIQTFSPNQKFSNHNIARYCFSLIHLERKLMKHPNMIETIQRGIKRIVKQTEHFPVDHENIIAALANLYTNTLSTFEFRIYITGEPLYLNQTANINKIRALLLAGIRAAVLWRQLGGRRWQLIFSKNYILETAKALITPSIPKAL